MLKSSKNLTFDYKTFKIIEALQAKIATKNKGLGKMKTLPSKPQKKSLWDRMNEIPDGKFKGLLSLLEPHELPTEK